MAYDFQKICIGSLSYEYHSHKLQIKINLRRIGHSKDESTGFKFLHILPVFGSQMTNIS